ncbi:MAG: Rpp14/Pop5 family protein [Methanobacteriota archaeon]
MIKILPPSLREKKRYVAFRAYSEEPLKREEVIRAVWSETLAFFGENIASEINLWVLNFDEASQKGFLVCSHREVGKVKAALTLVSMVNGKKVFLQTLGVSGTIKALKRKFLNSKEQNK